MAGLRLGQREAGSGSAFGGGGAPLHAVWEIALLLRFLSRTRSDTASLTHTSLWQVFARWYRPPELFYGSTCYGPGVDIWAAGGRQHGVLAAPPCLHNLLKGRHSWNCATQPPSMPMNRGAAPFCPLLPPSPCRLHLCGAAAEEPLVLWGVRWGRGGQGWLVSGRAGLIPDCERRANLKRARAAASLHTLHVSPYPPRLHTDLEVLGKIYNALGTPQDEGWAGLRAMPGFVEFQVCASCGWGWGPC